MVSQSSLKRTFTETESFGQEMLNISLQAAF